MTEEAQLKASALEALSQSRANASQLASLAESVKEFVGSVNKKLDSLDAKLDGKTQTNWPVIWSALGVVAMIVIPLVTAMYVFNQNSIAAQREMQTQYQIQMNTRMEFQETIAKDELKHRAYLWDNLVYDKLTRTPQ